MSPWRSCGLIIPTSPKSIMSGKINIMGLTARPDMAMSAITAPTVTSMITGSRIFITGCGCGFCAAGTGSTRRLPVGSGGTSGAAATGTSTGL